MHSRVLLCPSDTDELVELLLSQVFLYSNESVDKGQSLLLPPMTHTQFHHEEPERVLLAAILDRNQTEPLIYNVLLRAHRSHRMVPRTRQVRIPDALESPLAICHRTRQGDKREPDGQLETTAHMGLYHLHRIGGRTT